MTDHHDVQELLGAYALDALDPDEVAAVEAHLEVCARCRRELAGYREVTSLLGHTGGEAPPGVWDRIAAGMHPEPSSPPLERIGEELLAEVRRPAHRDGAAPGPGSPPAGAAAPAPLAPPGAGPLAPPRSGRRRPRWQAPVAWLAAAAVIAVAVLGVEVADLHRRLSRDQRVVAAAPATMGDVRAALAQPGHRSVTLRGPGSASLAVVLLPSGVGYVYDPHLHPLPSDRTYQLWGVVGSQAVSYGLLGARPTTVEEFRAGAGVKALAVTDEVASGVVVTHQPFSVSGSVPAAV